MDWMDQVLEKAKRKNQILFSKDSPLLHGLAQLLPRQDRRVLILWALDLAEETVQALENRHPDEPRPRSALTSARLWAAGDVKMPSARREILRCHALAKELPDPAERALCHAVGQACSVVHTGGHAMGYPIYELTALVLLHGMEHCREPVEARVRDYQRRLSLWQERMPAWGGRWAAFLCQ